MVYRVFSLLKSHSLRSAWIEIATNTTVTTRAYVALLTECVDRNITSLFIFLAALGRTPYGVRG